MVFSAADTKKLLNALRDSRFVRADDLAAALDSPRPGGVEVLRAVPWEGGVHVLVRLGAAVYQVVMDTEITQDVTSQRPGAIVAAVQAGGGPFGTTMPAGGMAACDPNQAQDLGADQSNTSLRCGGVIVKVLRSVQPGTHPEVEVLAALKKVGCAVVPEYVAHTELELPHKEHAASHGGPRTARVDRCVTTLAVENVPNAGTLWDSVLGGRFTAKDATALGQRLRILHRDLARALPTAAISGDAVAAALQRRLDDLLVSAPELGQHEAWIRSVYAEISGRPEVPVQRVHGDLHLGQILEAERGAVFVDFEGEPSRPLAERTSPDPVEKDVAGMIRSFAYAERSADGVAGKRLEAAFLEGYGELDEQLLHCFVADKAAYELAYELAHRPMWAGIPRAALEELRERYAPGA